MKPIVARAWPAAVLLGLFLVSRASYTTVWMGSGRLDFGSDLLSRAAAAVRGERLHPGAIDRSTVLLDERLLREDLGRSLFYLHAQPPLFNAFIALVLKLPGDVARNIQWLNWGEGLALAALSFALAVQLGVLRAVALAFAAAGMLNPNTMWMESAVYYGLPVAVLLAASALALHRALARDALPWFAVFGSLITVVALSRAQFTLPWCVAASAFGAACLAGKAPPGRRRRIFWIAAAPCVVLGAYQAKQVALFGQWTSSSWLGFNLTAMTGGMGAEKEEALAHGEVSALVKVPRYSPPSVYRAYFRVPKTGIPALDEDFKSGGSVNQNNLVYLPASRLYLRDALRLIVKAPHKYAGNVLNAVYVASGIQNDMYFLPPRQFLQRWGWLRVAAPFVGFPVLVAALVWGFRRARPASGLSRPARLTVIFLAANVLYVLAVGCLLEKSETVLYRVQVDAYLYALLGLAVTERLLRRRVRD
jgi:hypothetical protein